MSPKQFAKMLQDTSDCREASYDKASGQYGKSWDDAAIECCPEPWARIVAILIFPGYADVWDWCEAVNKL